jgi:arginine/lysine/ornithine decarboxylase
MRTPICDFVKEYAGGDALRLHMPGHKGASFLGMESLDITEITGADSLYEAGGIIAESEANASELFGCPTYYATEGSSQCIRAMLQLVSLYAKKQGKKPLIAAGRNAHKAFVSAVALLDVDVLWLYPEKQTSYLSCQLSQQWIEAFLQAQQKLPTAVYLTSPDYLGSVTDIAGIAKVCHKYGVLLVVDNAHGAYLKFLPESQHPMDLGADLCCDSAHKTLPVLTGGAYLHISSAFPKEIARQTKNAMMLFGSTSPSYLILQSLDAANLYLQTYATRLQNFLPQVQELKQRLSQAGYSLYGDEPLKLTVSAKPYGYTGTQLAQLLEAQNIVPEFADPDYLVLMLTPETELQGLCRLEQALLQVPVKPEIKELPPIFSPSQKVLSVREAMLSDTQILPASQCLDRVLAHPGVGCPPAVPIAICGERIDEHALSCFAYYGIGECCVVRNP